MECVIATQQPRCRICLAEVWGQGAGWQHCIVKNTTTQICQSALLLEGQHHTSFMLVGAWCDEAASIMHWQLLAAAGRSTDSLIQEFAFTVHAAAPAIPGPGW